MVAVGPCLLVFREASSSTAPPAEPVATALGALTQPERQFLLARNPSLRDQIPPAASPADSNVSAWLPSSAAAAATSPTAGFESPREDFEQDGRPLEDEEWESVSARGDLIGRGFEPSAGLGAPPPSAAPKPAVADGTAESSADRAGSGGGGGMHDAMDSMQKALLAAIELAAKANGALAAQEQARLEMSPAAAASPRDLARRLDLEDYDAVGSTGPAGSTGSTGPAATRRVTLADLGAGIAGGADANAFLGGEDEGDSSIFRPDAADATREMTSWEREQQATEAASQPQPRQQGRKATAVPSQAGSRLPVRSGQQRRQKQQPLATDGSSKSASTLRKQLREAPNPPHDTRAPDPVSEEQDLEEMYRGLGLLSPASRTASPQLDLRAASPEELTSWEAEQRAIPMATAPEPQRLQQPSQRLQQVSSEQTGQSPVRVGLNLDELASPSDSPAHHAAHHARSLNAGVRCVFFYRFVLFSIVLCCFCAKND